ncbi:MAG: hypothetical protein A2W25_05650 [candidate division Zixibacteria bacterium RBG_16_53_22]|nr:MAG: hypothetical protein A2W25_05650 [candidate division Zixibacteria bacterium RBG_16_53_22]
MKILLIILLLPSLANAELVLSEVFANEPGDTVELEWIETYNAGNTSLWLGAYRMIAGEDTLDLPPYYLNANSHMVIARQLVADSGQPSFEARWGNASGLWGDGPSEFYLAIDMDFGLSNSAGSVALVKIGDSYRDYYEWSESTPDGISLERDDSEPPSGNWHHCTDPSGSTPGRPNSPAVEPITGLVEFTVSPRIINLSRQETFRITILSPDGGRGLIEIFDDAGRRVVTLLDAPIGSSDVIYWNGWDREFNKLAPGIYLIHASISGSVDITKTTPVVIAP